jgi:hypothetical protein
MLNTCIKNEMNTYEEFKLILIKKIIKYHL